MDIFNLFKNLTFIEKDKLKTLEKGMDDLKTIHNYLRPEDSNILVDTALNWGISDTRVTNVELYQLSMYSDILQNVLNTLRNEIFRNGFEYDNITTFENDFQLKKIEKIIRKANLNNQTLIDVFMELETDLNVVDNAYLFARKNYFLNSNNEIIGGEVEEFLRIDPLSVEILFDATLRIGNDKDGNALYFNPSKRSEVTRDEFAKDGRKNLKACYKVKSFKKGLYQYYDQSEILHVSKYRPTKTYGFSPLFSLYNKVVTLINMDFYIKQYYSGNKVPKGLLTVNTTNAQGFWTFWDMFIEKVRKNPHAINPLIHQSGDGKDPIKWIDFMRNLQEMQYTDVRNEIRTQIGAVYNVSPIFQNDVSTGGGLNNEGLQITVTDRGVEMGQRVYNDKVLPWICEQTGVSDYNWYLLPSKEQDQLAEKELRLKDLAIAKATAELGIHVTMNDTGDFSFKEGTVKVKSESPNLSEFYNLNKSCQVKKELSPKEIKEVENALLNELEKLLQKFNTKTRPSLEELNKKISETVKDFDKVIKSKSSKKLKAIYQKAMLDLGKELGRNFTLTEIDKNVIEALKRDVVYQKAFNDMNIQLSDKLKKAITEAYSKPEGFSINDLVNNMKEHTEIIESDLRRIARTETTKISVAARKVQYDKTGEKYKYFHIGPDDERTTQASKEVKQLTKDGVSWDEYINIVDRVSKKYNPNWSVNKEAPITHPNTRHVFIAKRIE